MKLVKPQHFLPVHGEYAFLCAHAQLAKDIGIRETSVIRNGQYLGVSPRRNGKTVSSGSMQLLGEAKLQMFYNDGGRVRIRAPSCFDGLINAMSAVQCHMFWCWHLPSTILAAYSEFKPLLV